METSTILVHPSIETLAGIGNYPPPSEVAYLSSQAAKFDLDTDVWKYPPCARPHKSDSWMMMMGRLLVGYCFDLTVFKIHQYMRSDFQKSSDPSGKIGIWQRQTLTPCIATTPCTDNGHR